MQPVGTTKEKKGYSVRKQGFPIAVSRQQARRVMRNGLTAFAAQAFRRRDSMMYHSTALRQSANIPPALKCHARSSETRDKPWSAIRGATKLTKPLSTCAQPKMVRTTGKPVQTLWNATTSEPNPSARKPFTNTSARPFARSTVKKSTQARAAPSATGR